MRGNRHLGASMAAMRAVALAPLVMLPRALAQTASSVIFKQPTNTTTCTQYTITWYYAIDTVSPESTFDLEVTNVGVPQIAPPVISTQTTSSTQPGITLPGGSVLPTISSFSNPGTFPTTTSEFPSQSSFLRPRQNGEPVEVVIAQDITVASNGHTFAWQVNVPQGWYIFNGSDPSGILAIQSSSRFFVATGDTSCLGASGSSGSSAGQGGPTASPKSAGGVKPGVIAGAVIGVAAIIGIFAALWIFFLCGRRGRINSPRARSRNFGHLGSHDSRASAGRHGSFSAAAPGKRLSRAAELQLASVGSLGRGGDPDDDSLEEKLPASPADVARPHGHRYSAGSSASGYGTRARVPSTEGYPLGPVSRSQTSSTGSQPHPRSAAPTPLPRSSAPTPNPYPGTPHAPTAAGAKRTPRKAVPTYDVGEMAAALPADDESTFVGSHSSHGPLRKMSSTDALVGLGLGNGSSGQVHYLIPDMPPPRRD